MRPLLILLCLLSLNLRAETQSLSNPNTCENLTSAIRPFIEYGMFQGSLLLAKNGETLCEVNRGYTDTDKHTPITHDSRFPIASLSKPIVAALLLKLQENGDVALHSTLDTYLPQFNAPWKHQVTLHHLLANRSGLPTHFTLPGWRNGRYTNALPKQALLEDIARLDLAFTPGTQYLYTNFGWILLAEVVQSATGKSLADNLQAHIFGPLSMKATGMVSNANTPLVGGLRWGHQGNWQPHEQMQMQVFNAGAGLYSTTGDLLRFLQAVHQGDLLSPKSKKRMFSSDAPYGWRTETLALSPTSVKRVRSYDGQLNGHSSFVYHLPDDDLSLIMLTHTGMGFEHKKALADDVLSTFYGLSSHPRQDAPSLMLNQSLLDNQWTAALASMQSQPVKGLDTAILLHDLAQQLDWSGHPRRAIDLYTWLLSSYPGNEGLKRQRQTLCDQHFAYAACLEKRNLNVGMTLLPLQDKTRNAWRSDQPRPVATHVFYPTKESGSQPLMLGPKSAPVFEAGTVVREGKPAEGKRPLVLMSHGTGGSAPQMLWLAQALVEAGFLVAAVNHHGNTAFESHKYPEGFLLWWERARDLGFAHKQLLQDNHWSKLIDANRVAVVGFSLGGYTTLSALGGITDKALFDDYCQQATDDFSCQPQPEFSTVLTAFEQVRHSAQVVASNERQHDSYQISGVKAGVLIAPAVLHAFRPDSMKSMHTPTLLLGGSKDEIAPVGPNAVYADSLLPNSQLAIIENAHHYSFLSTCTERGMHALKQLCEEPHGVTRREVHQRAISQVVPFLRQHLQ